MFRSSRVCRVLLLAVVLLQSGCMCWRHGRHCCYEPPAGKAIANHGP